MDSTTENMFNNVNHLIERQRFVMEEVTFLEEKRQELTDMIQNLSDSVYKETLENQINKMEIKLFIQGVTDKAIDKAEGIDVCVEKKKKTIKCRYYDRGFCKSKSECGFFHSEKICNKILSNEKFLEPKVCLQRHPKDCKHWMGDTRGCLRENECKYIHDSNKKGQKIKQNKSYTKNTNDEEIVNDTSDRIDEKKDKFRIDSLTKEVEAKEEELKKKEDKISVLLSEKETLIEENNRIKRCAKNMDLEIKLLRSQTH